MDEKYNNILELYRLLQNERVDCRLEVAFDGYVITGVYGDVAEHQFTHGLEAYKFDCCNGDILPDLTIEEAFNLFVEEAYIYGKKV